MNKVLEKREITLIVLVITIIILLILAGVAIATLTGENGLFARAKQTQTESEMKEKLNITEVENKSGIEFSYEIVKRENGKVKILIKVQDGENGINKVEIPGDAIILNGTREEKGIDLEIEVGTEYKFKVISVSGKEREETILIEPEIIVGEAYIGTSTTNTNVSNSVVDNSQTRGITLYINFTATLEGTACTVKLKGGADSDTLPYAITKNGTYTFVVTGTYGEGKIITKEVEIKVNKYQAATGLVKYDAGDWTEAEINTLNEKSLYNINTAKVASTDIGLNFTFGGFTYAKDSSGNANTTYANEISNGTVITSRNQSVALRSGWGIPAYDGWQILEIQDSTGNKITNETTISNKLDNLSSGEKVYVTKLMHAGSPENFVYYYTTSYDNKRVEYILSGGIRQTEYNTLNNGTVINGRDWSMYEDKSLKAKGYIDEVHAMTYDEAKAITGSRDSTNVLRNTKAYYWLASAYPSSDNYVWDVTRNGNISNGYYNCWGVRPVVSLASGVYITGGDGTEGNEYVLGKE